MKLTRTLHDELLAASREAMPNEACGILAGPPGGDPVRLIPLRNTSPSPHRYTVDPVEQLAAYRDMDDRGEDPLVIWHSHPHDLPRPSPTDIRAARDPQALYLIVSLLLGARQMQCWRIVGGQVTEEPVEVIL